MKRRLLLFARGKMTSGGSGFANLVRVERAGLMPHTEIVGVISSLENGRVRQLADELGIRFGYLPNQFCNEIYYQRMVADFGAEYVGLSGWLQRVVGLNPCTTFNIHNGPLPGYGGPDMWGHHVHVRVMEDYRKGLITHSGPTMHFVDGEYDHGPTFFHRSVEILEDDTADTLGDRVNLMEHKWQPVATDRVCAGEIYWDGINASSLVGAML